jgi:hypothetical protein
MNERAAKSCFLCVFHRKLLKSRPTRMLNIHVYSLIRRLPELTKFHSSPVRLRVTTEKKSKGRNTTKLLWMVLGRKKNFLSDYFVIYEKLAWY